MDTTTTSAPAPSANPLAAIPAPYPQRARALAIARNLDLVLLPVGYAAALALGAPVFGCSVGAGAWVLQRGLAVLARGLVNRAAEPGNRLGLNFVEAFARIWLLAGAIIAAGVIGHRTDGLAAALAIFAAYSLAFAVRIASGRPVVEER